MFEQLLEENIFPIDKVVLNTIFNRGIQSKKEIHDFLYPSVDQLHDPFLFKEMGLAVTRIQEALVRKESIVVWGDYDVDGVCSSSLLYLALKQKGANVKVYVPDRHGEGYGLNREGFNRIVAAFKPKLLITVDCGITSAELIREFKDAGVDTIVTDHHEISGEVPSCVAVIDPMNFGETYPYHHLCGAGVAFKLVEALFGWKYAQQFMDLVAIATISDVMPLTKENRVLVHLGLQAINTNPRLGVQALIEELKKTQKIESIKASNVAFGIGPMINAQGRLAHNKDSVSLLVSKDANYCRMIAEQLGNLNRKRKEIEQELVVICRHVIEKNPLEKVVIVEGHDWEGGVIGIVASRLVELYHRPTLVFTYDPVKRVYTGSARSIPHVSIHQLLSKCDFLLEKWGGHAVAAGLTVSEDNWEFFKTVLLGEAEALDEALFEKTVFYDQEIPLHEVNDSLISDAHVLEPCGMGNPKITYMTKGVDFVRPQVLGKEAKHFRTTLFKDSTEVSAIAFNKLRPNNNNRLSVVYQLGYNEFNGSTTIQAQIQNYLEHDEEPSLIQYNSKPKTVPLNELDVSETKASQFLSRGIHNLETLLRFLPQRYKDYSTLTTVKDLILSPQEGVDVALCGTIKKIHPTKKMVLAFCVDDSHHEFSVGWFGREYLARQLRVGVRYIFCGKAKTSKTGGLQLFPELWSPEIEQYQRIIPVYKKIKGMSDDFLLNTLQKGFMHLENKEVLSRKIIEQFNLPTTSQMLRMVHFPKTEQEVLQAKKRLIFDSLFQFNFLLKLNEKFGNQVSDFKMTHANLAVKVVQSLPYALTGDQRKTLNSFISHFRNDTSPINSLIQGDVGSGKTIVAFLLMCIAYENGYQSVLVAPTEVLAQQHALSLKDLMEPFGIDVVCLTGSTKAAEKKKITQAIRTNQVQMIVGTHAVLQASVTYSKLGLAIIDEQHRFGVDQRNQLLSQGFIPHFVTMSATPIPRTLSMALFGNSIQVFNIFEKPQGRKKIQTLLMETDKEINQFMYSEIQKGRQCYVVCPLIEESETEGFNHLKSVAKEAEAIRKAFAHYPDILISDISGKLKSEEVDMKIARFKNGETQILISTTIVEVGVNVPNASVMVLKSSERFGLAQAHQLRGRVGRGDYQSYCILQSTGLDKKSEILCHTEDGFEIAKEDLKLRGAGDYLGTQQSGDSASVMLMIEYPELYHKIDALNQEIFSNDGEVALYKKLLNFDDSTGDLSQIKAVRQLL